MNERGGYRCVGKDPSDPVETSTMVTTTTSTARPTASPRVPCPRGYLFSEDSRRCVGTKFTTVLKVNQYIN